MNTDAMQILDEMNTNTRLMDFPQDIHHIDYPFKNDSKLESELESSPSTIYVTPEVSTEPNEVNETDFGVALSNKIILTIVSLLIIILM